MPQTFISTRIGSARRQFLQTAAAAAAGLAWPWTTTAQTPPTRIMDVRIGTGVEVVADDGTTGFFSGSPHQDLDTLKTHLGRIRERLVGANPLDVQLTGEMLWEAICPEHLDGYARIKGETGLPLAGGEHWYTRWAVKPFLDRSCVDFVQSDPTWCGGISEWLSICELVRQYPGVKVVPHITSPWLVAPHCVASQPEDLCPLLEYNSEGGQQTLEPQMRRQRDGRVLMVLPQAPGIS